MPRKENQKEQIFLYTITTQNVKLCEKTKQISMERNFEFWGTIWSHGTCSGVNLLHTVPILWKMHLWKMLRMSQDCCGIDWSATIYLQNYTCDRRLYDIFSKWQQFLETKLPERENALLFGKRNWRTTLLIWKLQNSPLGPRSLREHDIFAKNPPTHKINCRLHAKHDHDLTKKKRFS